MSDVRDAGSGVGSVKDKAALLDEIVRYVVRCRTADVPMNVVPLAAIARLFQKRCTRMFPGVRLIDLILEDSRFITQVTGRGGTVVALNTLPQRTPAEQAALDAENAELQRQVDEMRKDNPFL